MEQYKIRPGCEVCDSNVAGECVLHIVVNQVRKQVRYDKEQYETRTIGANDVVAGGYLKRVVDKVNQCNIPEVKNKALEELKASQ